MTITEDPTALVSGADMVRWFIGLLAVYIIVAFWLGFRPKWSKFWKKVGGLSVFASCIWLIIAVALSYLVIMDRPSDIPAESYALSATFGIPFQWKIATRLLSIPDRDIPFWLNIVCPLVVVETILFAIATIPYNFAQLAAQFLRNRSKQYG